MTIRNSFLKDIAYYSASELLAIGQSFDNHQFAEYLYQKILFQPATDVLDSELIGWLEEDKVSRLLAIHILAHSDRGMECSRVFFSWQDLLHPDSHFLPDLYSMLLKRGIDEGGHAHFQNQIEAGTLTRAGIILSVAQSQECRAGGPLEISIDGLTADNTRPLVHIVLADRGWIVERLAREIERRLPYVTVGSEPNAAPIQYFLPYSAWRGNGGMQNVALFTHLETDAVMRERFIRACHEMDLSIFMSEAYRAIVEEHAPNSARITPGVDLDTFPLASLRIGVAGRTYGTGRKGEAMVAQLMDLPGVEWHFSGSGWPGPAVMYDEHERHRFFHAIDYLLVPSLYEGGPMTALEALACGKPLIAPEIGFISELPHISYPVGDVRAVRAILAQLVEERRSRRKAVRPYSWENWASQHHAQFQYLLEQKDIAVPPSLIAAKDRDTLRVGLVLHAPEGQGRIGGPARRVQETATALNGSGHSAIVHHGDLPSLAQADLVHLFNVWEPRSAIDLLESARRRRLPTVFSSIFLDLSVMEVQERVTRAFQEARTFREVEQSLADLEIHHQEAVSNRRATLDRLLPGYLGQVEQMLARTDHLILTSQFERDLLTDCGLSLPRHSIVHNAASDQLQRAVPAFSLPPIIAEGGYILCVGSMDPRKNQLLLAQACREIDRPLVFVGGQDEQPYGNLVRRFSSPWTHFTGHIRDNNLLRSIIENAAVLALPSWAEGAPLSVLDAGALGIPLVASNQSSEREYFGEHACYCDPWNIESIHGALRSALDADTTSSRERRASFVQSKYNYRKVADELIAIYAGLIQGDAEAMVGAIESEVAEATDEEPTQAVLRLISG